jgi:hypothetical protein
MRHRLRFLSVFVLLISVTIVYPAVSVASSQLDVKASIECVCGPKKVAVLLFDFVDVKHTKTPEYYSAIVKSMNASFYRQSYGQMWIVGGEVYGWYETTLELHSLRVTTWYIDWADADKLEAVAKTKAGQLKVAGSYIFAVFAGDVWAWATGYPSKMTVIGETHSRNPLRSFMHEFGHNLGLPDLYNYGNLDAEPVGEWDLMDRGEEELSAWSRVKLGWISSDSIAKMYPTRDQIVFIESLDSPSGTRLVKVQLEGAVRYLLAETRRTSGGLRLVVYRIEGSIESGKGSIVLEAVMDPASKAVFFDKKIDATFIVLELQSNGLSVMLTREKGQNAQDASDTIYSASLSIDSAWSSNRVQGLEDAKEELSSAWDSFHKGDFDAAMGFAQKARQLAESATTPESYSQVLQLREKLTAQIQNASFKSDEAIRYLTVAKTLMQEADDLSSKKDFDEALQKLQEADQNLSSAFEAEKTQTTQITSLQVPGKLPIIVGTVGAIVVGVVALLRMRRKTRMARAATAVVSPAQSAPSVGPLAADKFCINCGAPLPAHAAVCETCGSKQ